MPAGIWHHQVWWLRCSTCQSTSYPSICINRPKAYRGRRMEAQWSLQQSSFNACCWSPRGGTGETSSGDLARFIVAQGRHNCRDQKNDGDAEWSPKHRKSCFCVTAPATFVPSLKNSFIYRQAGETQQVAQKRQNEGGTIAMVAQEWPWSANGGSVVTTVIV